MDRDGVINEKPLSGEYVCRWQEFRLIPQAVDWIRLFNALGLLVIVVTNQRGIALGHLSAENLEGIHENMRQRLADFGARIDDIYTCPHNIDSCDCRKPKPGLVLEAARKWQISMQHSILIGDSLSDQELAATCGLRFIPVTNGRIVASLAKSLSLSYGTGAKGRYATAP